MSAPPAIKTIGFIGLGVMGERPPEVREEPVGVVDRLRPARAVTHVVRSSEEHGEGPGERFDVVVDVAECGPHLRRNATLAAEPHERGLHSVSRW